MKIAADRTGSMAFALQAVLRLSNVAFAAHLESACGWVAARHQKPALAPAAGRCSSLPALPLGRSRCRSGCDSPCSHVISAMPARACRSPMLGPPPGHNAGTPARTPAARHTTGGPGAGTPDHGRPPRTHRPQAGTAIRWPRATPPRIPSRGRRNTGVPDPRGCAASGCDDRHHAGLLPRAHGTLRSPPGSQRSAVQKQEEINKCRRR